VYSKGSRTWWSEVVRRTALGAGADPKVLDESLPEIVSRLMARFSTKEGYRAFDDAIPCMRCLAEMNIMTAVVSNADFRLRAVLRDLDFPSSLDTIVVSEEEGFEKPSPEIFFRAITQVNQKIKRQDMIPIKPEECLHVGDELESDYNGAVAARMNALLLRRPGPDGQQAHRHPQGQVDAVQTVKDLGEVIHWMRASKARQ